MLDLPVYSHILYPIVPAKLVHAGGGGEPGKRPSCKISIGVEEKNYLTPNCPRLENSAIKA
jgi:hypothetical protein